MIADLKPYPEYKESGPPWLGRVPEHWEVRKLKQVSQRFWSGGTPQSGNDKYYCDAPHGYPWLMIGDLTVQRRVRRTRKHITESGRTSRNLEILPAGTILYSMYASLGTAAVLDIDAAINQAIIGITPRHTLMSGDFLLYSLEHLKTSLPSLASSSTQANLSAEKVRLLQICFPPATEQAAIVRFLDGASGRLERAIRAKRKVIALLNEQKQAIIHRAVTRGLDSSVPLKPSGIPWLGDIPQHWRLVPAKRVIDTLTDFTANGSFAALAHAVEYRSAGYARLVRMTDLRRRMANRGIYVDESAYRFLGKSKLVRGDVLLGNVGSAGVVYRMPEIDTPATLGPNMYLLRFRERECSNAYAHAYLSSPGVQVFLRRLATTTAQPKLNKDDIKGLPFVVPPSVEQATIIEQLAEDTEALNIAAFRLEREIELLREYRTRLVADVVTGKLDVREAATGMPGEAPPEAIEDNTARTDGTDLADEEPAG